MAALNLGPAGAAQSIQAPDVGIAWWGWGVALIPIVLPVLLGYIVPRLTARRDWTPPFKLSTLPGAGKLLVLFYLAATGLTHAFAAGAIWQATRVVHSSNPEYFRFMSVLQLFRMSHQHAFGHGTMYFLLGGLALLSAAPEYLKTLGISLTFMGALSDLASWWLQKFCGASFEALSEVGGVAFAAGFILLAGIILRDLARRPPG